MTDVMKEYLVGLGFTINQAQYNKVANQLKQFEGLATKTTGNVSKGMSTGAIAVMGFLVSVNQGIASLIDGLAQADMQTQRFARRMWMTYDSAKSLQGALGAMGEDMSTLGDVAINPELRQRFFALRSQAEGMNPQGDYAEQMKKVRDISFEFMRMKLEISYGLQWVGYYLTKYLEKPLSAINEKLKGFNDNLQKNMPKYAEKIAKVLTWFVQLGQSAVSLFTSIPPLISAIALALTPIGRGMMASLLNPVTLTIAAIIALLLLFDDYQTYLKGGKSLMEDMWKSLDGGKKGSFGSGLNKDLESISKSLESMATSFENIFGKDWTKNGLLIFLEGVSGVLDTIAGTLNSIAKTKELLNPSDKKQQDWDKLTDGQQQKKVEEWLKNNFSWLWDAADNFYKWSTDRPGNNPKNQSYQYYPTQQSASGNTTVTLTPVYNIYGATADGVMTVADRYNQSLIRQVKPVFV